MTRPELLSPAGDLERLQYAIRYGADAVYAALTEFGMRAAPDNFTPAQLEEGCIFAHARGKRVYLTLNTLPTNAELDRLPQAIADARAAGVDGFIVADLGVLRMVQKLAPDVEIHFSTQMGITNHAAATAAFELGAKRVVLARNCPWRTSPPSGPKPAGTGTGGVCARSHVHERVRPVPAQPVSDRTGCQPGPVRPALPLEISSGGGDPPRPVYGNRGG